MVIFLGHPYLSKAGHPVLRGLQGRACRPSRERGEVAGSRWEAFWAPEELTKWWLFLREITRLWFWGMVLGIPKLIWISKKTKTRDRFWVLVRSLFLLIIWGTFPEHNYFCLLRLHDSQAYRYTTLYISNLRGSSWWNWKFLSPRCVFHLGLYILHDPELNKKLPSGIQKAIENGHL